MSNKQIGEGVKTMTRNAWNCVAILLLVLLVGIPLAQAQAIGLPEVSKQSIYRFLASSSDSQNTSHFGSASRNFLTSAAVVFVR